MKKETFLNNAQSVDDYRPKNHAERRKFIRNTLRDRRYIITDRMGNQHSSNELRKVMNAEKNFKTWLERVHRAQEAGKEIHRRNLEIMYEQQLNDDEKRQEQRLVFLTELYGKEKGTKQYEKELNVIAKKYQDYYNEK